jgi:tetratricopeptide (TPR) repeat protein
MPRRVSRGETATELQMKMSLSILVCLVFLTNGAAQAQDIPPNAKFDVWLPGKPWALEFDGAGFTAKSNEIKPDGRRYFLAENTKTRMVVSVFLEAAKAPAQPGECKRALEEKAKRNSSLATGALKSVAYRESGEMQILEFTLPELDGQPTNQKNIFGCLIKDDVFVDIHVSKVFARAADQPLFDALLQSVHFVPKESTAEPVVTGNSMQLFQEGSRYFIAHQYRESIAPYQKAFEIEKSTPTLEKNIWRVLLDNLSIAYGISGDLTSAREVLTYGVSRDPDYPLFYYNLACVTAEKGDLPDTENYLKLAFERRENVIPGETFPDARVDDSFQKLLLQKEFRRFVHSLYGQPQ